MKTPANMPDNEAFEDWFLREIVRPAQAAGPGYFDQSHPAEHFIEKESDGTYKDWVTCLAYLAYMEATSRERDFIQGCFV